jgi:hypothetical protein
LQKAVCEIYPRLAVGVDLWITNPPWPEPGQRGDPAVSIILHLMAIAPVWVILPWDFATNAYFARLYATCTDIVPVGRVSWMGNGQGGKDNAAWFRFDAAAQGQPILRRRPGVAEKIPANVPEAKPCDI